MALAFTPQALPPEIWSHIIGNIPKPSLTPILHVCSLFHAIAIRLLFASIKIYFVGGNSGANMLNTSYDTWMEDIAKNLMTKSFELLTRICQEPSFGAIVKNLTVVAFGDGLSVFESRQYDFLQHERRPES